MTDYLRDPNNLDPSDPEAYAWPVVDLDDAPQTIVGNSFAVRRLKAYDDSYLDVGHAFLDALDIATDLDTEVVMSWGNPEPVRLEFTLDNLDPDLLALIFGQPVIPLCQQVLPAEGQE